MKNKFLLVALIAVILSAGMVLVSCGGCPGDGKCSLTNFCGDKVPANTTADSETGKKVIQCAVDIITGKNCAC